MRREARGRFAEVKDGWLGCRAYNLCLRTMVIIR